MFLMKEQTQSLLKKLQSDTGHLLNQIFRDWPRSGEL